VPRRHHGQQRKAAYKVAFLLDEFAQLGRMQAVEDAISLVRGYGAAFWLFVQDLSQLKAIYPKWQTFLANTKQAVRHG
jgi:type IV secretion system protein VirD4